MSSKPSSRVRSSAPIPRNSLVALPTLSGGLCNLPQANSMANLALHPSTMARNAKESEEKLRKSIQATAASRASQLYSNRPPTSPPSPGANESDSAPLMMRPLRTRS